MAKAKVRPVPANEKVQVRARRAIGHDFALKLDSNGRERLRGGTAESVREYEIRDSGSVAVRSFDPVSTLVHLSDEQKAAALKYRDLWDVASSGGIKTASWDMRVDGHGASRERPQRITDALAAIADADKALGYGEIQRVVRALCAGGMTISQLSEKERNPRAVISKLFGMGLQQLAVHFGIVAQPKR